ncbi:adenylate/guanylate cyclase domain-containing protein [Desertibaculum subflavum]|uniref:adenylate/guanylate cyclase domain-containing protein n=1 Tax=Desertibaculum subflavum TaxID=2268458 RepID=UPI000E670B34
MAREQRKLAAIVSVDVVGYSRLMGRDEARTLARLKAHRAEHIDPCIEGHGGRIVKSTGDGLLLDFPSAVDALHCAIEVQEGMGRRNAGAAPDDRIDLRIGINAGDVICDGDDIFGDSVNVAARLQQIAAPGSVCVSGRVQHDTHGRLDASLSDAGMRRLKNIAEPVRVWAWGELPAHGAGGDEVPSRAGGQASIAVLPFVVRTGDPEIALLADGLAEDVIALLARVPGFLLISRSSSFAFRDRDLDVALIARQLDVRYAVEGSLRVLGAQVRVTTQLTDASTGRVLWSGRFEAPRDAAAELQDDIARGVIAELEPELTRAEIRAIHRQRPENVDAWGRYRQALGAVTLKGWNEAALGEARAHLQQAVQIDPQFALAHGYLALLTGLGTTTGIARHSDLEQQAAVRAAETAIDLDSGSSEVMGYAGCALADLGQAHRGVEILRRAVELDPSNAQAHVACGAALAISGSMEAGIEQMRHGIRISPHDHRLAFWRWALGGFLFRLGRVDEALQEAVLAARRDPKLHLARVLEAVLLAKLGRMEEARRALDVARRLRPQLTLEELAAAYGRRNAERIAPLWQPD